MKTLFIELHKARDAEGSYAIRVRGEDRWRAVKGFGSDFEKVWTVEFQGPEIPNDSEVSWVSVLERSIEASRLSDPVVLNVNWQSLNLT
jgi:hypothetical protein